ncbi:MAG: hypothetical protein WAM11_16490, partial [Cyanobium sp.]
LENWPWRGLGLHPLQLLQWVSLVSPRGTRIFRGALKTDCRQRACRQTPKRSLQTKAKHAAHIVTRESKPIFKHFTLKH